MIFLDASNFSLHFSIERINENHKLESFTCSVAEYALFLKRDALKFQNDYISNSFVLVDKGTGSIAAYISLIADSISLLEDEKFKINISHIPFNTLPSIKIAKLAVNENYSKTFNHIGSLLIDFSRIVALRCNQQYISCRVISVDADIEHDAGIPGFYIENGFTALQNQKYIKRTKTVPMYADIFPWDKK
jgi:hypothetical protein